MKPRWAVPALIVQLVTVFFAPTLACGKHVLVASDLWLGLWVCVALLDLRTLKAVWPFLVGSALVLLASYAHGAAGEAQAFHSRHELLATLTLFGWLAAARVVGEWSRCAPDRRDLKPLGWALSVSLFSAGLLMVLDQFCPEVRVVLGRVYHFNPEYKYWVGRAYGVFSSPVEGGVSMALGLLLLLGFRDASWRVRGPAAAAALAGVLCSRTLTASVALVASLGLVAAIKHRRRIRRYPAPLVIPAVMIGSGLLTMVWFGSPGLQTKVADLASWPGLWRADLTAVSSHFGSLFLGFGMAPYQTDNIFLWILVRSGLVGLGAFLFVLGRLITRSWPSWSVPVRASVVFLLLTGLLRDTLIFHPVMALLVAASIPVMAAPLKEA